MNVHIKTIPHSAQRYPTVGDWFFDAEGDLHVFVSSLGDEREEMLIAVHELVEVLQCKYQGVSAAEVDKFDIEFEKARPQGNTDEPGDEPNAPYHRQHCLATGFERILAAVLGVKWKEYEKKIESLG